MSTEKKWKRIWAQFLHIYTHWISERIFFTLTYIAKNHCISIQSRPVYILHLNSYHTPIQLDLHHFYETVQVFTFFTFHLNCLYLRVALQWKSRYEFMWFWCVQNPRVFVYYHRKSRCTKQKKSQKMISWIWHYETKSCEFFSRFFRMFQNILIYSP